MRLNPAGERLLGIVAAEALGRHLREVLGCGVSGGHAVDACPLAEVMTTGQPIAYRETAIAGAGGASIRVAGGYSAASPAAAEARDPGGRARATAIVRDISAVRALEELREGFVATVSHELRTPLSLIRGYAETILHLDLDPAEQRAYVGRIDEVAGRLSTLVDQILDITHLQADPLILERVPVSFASLVNRLRGDLEGTDRDSRLVSDFAGRPPAARGGSAPRVGQILENLGRQRLQVRAAGRSGDDLRRRRRRVARRGRRRRGRRHPCRGPAARHGALPPGVERPRVADPGTGLGLFICRRLVEAHGGRLRVDDRPDRQPGTRVAFTLPLSRGRRTTASRRRVAAAAAAGEADRG